MKIRVTWRFYFLISAVIKLEVHDLGEAMDKIIDQEVDIPLEGEIHKGNLLIPKAAEGLVLFAHGSGSSRLSSRNQYVASVLHKGGIATLLFDLLTEIEDRVYETRFDIELLTRRLLLTTDWVRQQDCLKSLRLAYFGASTGAAAALKAASERTDIKAVVSRGGRPDLAGESLPAVTSPVLLIVGGFDDVVIELNQQAFDKLQCDKSLEIVPGATHLFEESGTLEQAAKLAYKWFNKCLCE